MPKRISSGRPFVRGIAALALFTTTGATALALTELPSHADEVASTLIAQDTMSRTVSSGMGSAMIGGNYQLNASANVNIAGGHATATVKTGTAMIAALPGAVTLSARADSTFTLAKLPTTGSGVYLGVVLRQQTNGNGYTAQVKVAPDGRTRLGVNALVNGVQTSLGSLPIGAVKPAQSFVVEAEVTGTNPVTVKTRAWLIGTSAPAWQLTVNSTTATKIPTAGAVGVSAYTSTTTPVMTVAFDDVQAWAVDNAQPIGVPAGAKLTKHVGDIIVTQPGTILDHMDIAGFVKVRAANVKITNSIVRGSGPGTYNTGLIEATNGAVKSLLVQDTTLVPSTPSVWLDGVIGHDYTANRVDTYNVVDGFGVYNTTGTKQYANVTIKNSYIHDLSYFRSDPNHDDGTHNDGIQIQGGANVNVLNNTIQGFRSLTAGTPGSTISAAPGTGILAQGNVSPVSGLNIQNNNIDGEYYGIRIRSTVGTGQVGTVAGNRLGRNGYDWNGNNNRYQILIESKADITFARPLTSNVWAGNGTALAEGRTLGIRYGNY